MSVELPGSIINSRFQYSQRPQALPGNCAVCGTVERPVLDFGTQIDGYGAVLICDSCIRAAVQVLDILQGKVENPLEAQVVPLSFLDQEGINEYVHSALKSITALNTILDLNRVDSLVEQAKRENDSVHGDSERENNEDAESSDRVLISEGSDSVPANKGSQFAFDF